MFNIFKKNKNEEVKIDIPESNKIDNITVFNNILFEGKFYSSFFDRTIGVQFDLDADINYVEKCIDNFNNLNDEIKESLYNSFIAYNSGFSDYVGEDSSVPKDIKDSKILNYISDGVLIVKKPNTEEIGYQVEANCVWEEEHGLEFTIKDNKVIYVGEFCDISPWQNNDSLSNDEFNYANK